MQSPYHAKKSPPKEGGKSQGETYTISMLKGD